MFFDPDLVVPDPGKSLRAGAIAPWAGSSSSYYEQTLESLARHFGVSASTPFQELARKIRDGILYGTGEEPVEMSYNDGKRSYTIDRPFEGVLPNMERRFRETDSSWVREELGRYQNVQDCDTCAGMRLKPEALAVKLAGLHISQVAEMSIAEAVGWFRALSPTLTAQEPGDCAFDPEGNQRASRLSSPMSASNT